MKKERKGRLSIVLRTVTVLVLLAFILYGGIIGFICIQEAEVSKELHNRMEYDAIIVLGAQVRPDRTPSVQLTWRLDTAAMAYHQRNVPIVVCGAQGNDEPCTEAEIMKEYLISKGVPVDMIREDPDSFNTRENLQNAQRLLTEYDSLTINQVLIVTSDYHVPRALVLARDLGYNAEGLGSPCLPKYWLKNHAREALAWCKYWIGKYLHIQL